MMCLLWGFRFSQCCCWRYRSFGMWRCVPGQVVPDVWKGHSAFIFRVKLFGPEGTGTTVLWNFRNYLPRDTASHARKLSLPRVSLLQANTLFIVCLLRRQRRRTSGSNVWGEWLVAANVLAGSECTWSQQNRPYFTQESQSLWTTRFRILTINGHQF
jgi:hypothetical protein